LTNSPPQRHPPEDRGVEYGRASPATAGELRRKGRTLAEIEWKILNEGRAWKGAEALERFDLTPEKLEMVSGKLLWSDDARERLLGLLLENVGADRTVQFGDPEVWRAAVAKLPG
jgi:hypothetical protein